MVNRFYKTKNQFKQSILFRSDGINLVIRSLQNRSSGIKKTFTDIPSRVKLGIIHFHQSAPNIKMLFK